MPTLANITVKKADGTTDVTYTAVAGSAGDAPAVYKSKTIGTTVAEQPSLLVASKDNGPKTGRRVTVNYSWPIMSQDSGGNKIVAGRMVGTASVLIPTNQSNDVIAEQAAQFCNLLGSAAMKAAFTEGYAAS